MQPTPDLDPLSAIAVVLAVLVGPTVAPFAAAYTVILFGALVGLFIGLRTRHPSSRLSALGYGTVTMLTALFCTVNISNYLVEHYEFFKDGQSWLFFPVSMCITAYGEVWIMKLRALCGTLIMQLSGAKND